MSGNRHSCSIGIIIEKPEPNIGSIVFTPSSYWLKKPMTERQKAAIKGEASHQKRLGVEEIITAVLFFATMIIAIPPLFFVEYLSEKFWYYTGIFTVLLVLFLLSGLWMECKNRKEDLTCTKPREYI